MRFLRIILFLLFLPIVSSAQVSQIVNFFNEIPNLRVIKADDQNEYYSVQFKDYRNSEELGKPSLPYKVVRLLLPPNTDIKGVTVQVAGENEIFLDKKICPAQPQIKTSIYKEKLDFINPDMSVYNSETAYPERLVKVINNSYFDGIYHIVSLAVYPVQYLSKKNSLKYYSSISFSVNTSLSSSIKTITTKEKRKKYNQDLYENILKSSVDNPEMITSYSTGSKVVKSMQLVSTALPFYEYVIITPNSFKTAFNNFVSWKRGKGLNIGVVTTEEIYANYFTDPQNPNITDNAAKIRHYLKDGWEEGTTVYALLGGNYQYVPVRYGAEYCFSWSLENLLTKSQDFYAPADIYFADFNGNWDVNNNNILGEPTSGYTYPPTTPLTEAYGDSTDLGPEIFVGRLLCSNTQQISNWTDKVLKYEKNPGNGSYSYLINSLFTEADEMQDYYNWDNGITGTAESYVLPNLPFGFSYSLLKEITNASTYSVTYPRGSDIVSQMNSVRYGFWGWFNHGCPIGITAKASGYNTHNPQTGESNYGTVSMLTALDSYNGYQNQESEINKGLDNLTNQNFPSIIYAISCDVAPFDVYHPNWYGGCLNMAESFTMGSNYGGPAFLGNSRLGYIFSSSELFNSFLTEIKKSSIKGHIGQAELISKMNYSDHYLALSHNLVGCPEMPMWTYYPSQFDQADISMDASSIIVNTYIDGSKICATNINSGTNYFSVTESASIYTFNTSTRPLYITITKQNYIPSCYKTNFTSTVSGPTTITSGQNGTWTVLVAGGTAPYHYKWYYRNPSSQESLSGPSLKNIISDYWMDIGNDNSQLTMNHACNFDVKCVVTDNEGFKSIASFCSVTVSGQANIVGDDKSKNVIAKIPIEYSLNSFPNPFNPSTIISYSLANTDQVTIKVYNILSQEVATLVNETKTAGVYQARFNAGNLPSGIYVARIQAGEFVKSIKMQLVK
jgi:hypothetical protein